MPDAGNGVTGIRSPRNVLTTYLSCMVVSLFSFYTVAFSFLSPLPLMISFLRLGRWAGFSMPLVIFIVLSYSSTVTGLSYMLQFALPSVIISESIVRGYSAGKAFSLAVAITTGLILLTLALKSSGYEGGATGFVRDFTGTVINESISINEKAGKGGEELAQFRKMAPVITEAVSVAYYSLIASGIAFISWINVALLRSFVKRYGMSAPFGDLSKWKAPEHLVWGVVAGGLALFSGSEILSTFGINMLIILFVLYFFQGMAIISYHLNKRNVSSLLKSIGYIFIVWYLFFLVAVIGLFDLWADFRKLNPPREHKA